MASEFMRSLESENYDSVGELEHRLMSTAAIFNQVLISQLHDAAARGNLDALEDIIKYSDDPKKEFQKKDHARNTTLHWAAGAGHLEIVNFLLLKAEEFGILNEFIHAQNLLGDTALHKSVWRGHKEVVERLLDVGIDREIVNTMNQRAIDLVRENISIGCLLQGAVSLHGVISTSSDDDGRITQSDDDSYFLNLSDTSYSEEDEDCGVLLVENRMKNLFNPPESDELPLETNQMNEGNCDDDDDVPELCDDE